ncbi:hypothetical protein [Actinomyces provencensis]|uniref:hypothetical protein n=1 Tax=Actinomyces provencensis TaxID=1720198 RepID=UPI00096ACC08|nr:hypothetical protein [Actinomyces provencensis]
MDGESHVIEGTDGANAGGTRGHGRGWKLGTTIGILGLLGFVALMAVLLIGVLSEDPVKREFAVGLFPWALACLGIGVAGMVVAGSRTPEVDAGAEVEGGGSSQQG